MTTQISAQRTARGTQARNGGGLVVEGLSISFDGGVTQTVRDVSFTVGRGECVALVGESGSGKSVTARSLLGLAGRTAHVEARDLRLGDTDLQTLTEREWRALRGRDIGLVLQDALGSLDPLRRVGREVGEPLVIHDSASGAELRDEIRSLLHRVGVPEPDLRARQYPHELSGGLRQRALIASAIAANPGILIADEPTTALDVTVQARILRLLASLRDEGTGILLISHDLAVVAELADQVIVLRDGEIVESGRTHEVLTRPRSDYTRRLIASVPSEESRGRSLLTGEDFPARSPHEDARTVIAVSGLRKSYGPTRAVDDVSFELRAGEVLGIVGESGSGKSTVGRLVLGQIEPDAGEVSVHGRRWRDVRGEGRRALRRRIQTVSQDPLGSFDPRETVEKVIGEAIPHGRGRAAALARRARILELLESVGLGEQHLKRLPRTLSGGQRQRVAIARALATGPDVLVCDEAVSALDVTVQAQVLDLLEQLRAETGVAMVFISHDLGVVQHIADRVLVMKDGRVVEDGDVGTVLTSPQHPYTRELIDAIPALPIADD